KLPSPARRLGRVVGFRRQPHGTHPSAQGITSPSRHYRIPVGTHRRDRLLRGRGEHVERTVSKELLNHLARNKTRSLPFPLGVLFRHGFWFMATAITGNASPFPAKVSVHDQFPTTSRQSAPGRKQPVKGTPQGRNGRGCSEGDECAS